MKKIDWSKWGKALAVAAVSAMAVPELQALLPKESLPWVNGIVAAWALTHRYKAQEQPPKPQDPPQS